MNIRIDMKAIVAVVAAAGGLAQPAAAQEKPACPTGVYGDWTYQIKVDTIRLEQREAPVIWSMADGAEETTHGYAVSYYWSDPYEGQRQRLMDGESNLQVGLHILHPPQRDIRYNMVAFSRNAEHDRHDLDEALSIDGKSVLLPEDDGWNPQSTTSLYLSAGGPYDGPAMKTAFEEGGHEFTVTVWFKTSETATPKEYGEARLTVDSVADAIEALRPVMAAEKARQKETGIWCQSTRF